jgi:hypothetical protein
METITVYIILGVIFFGGLYVVLKNFNKSEREKKTRHRIRKKY